MTLTFQAPVRIEDKWGSGLFGASRGDRPHRGTDYQAYPESVLLSPVKGRVTKLGYPYSDDLSFRYVQVTDKNGDHHRFFYVDPLVIEGQNVKEGAKLGTVQDLTKRYEGILNHVHYEIKESTGLYLNPELSW